MNVGLARALPGRQTAAWSDSGHPAAGRRGGRLRAVVLPAAHGRLLREMWGLPVPPRPDGQRPDDRSRSTQGGVDLVWSVAAISLLDAVRTPDALRLSLQRPRLRVHQDIVLSCRCWSRATATCGSCRRRHATNRPAAAPIPRPIAGSSSHLGSRPRRIRICETEWQFFSDVIMRAFSRIAAAQMRFESAQSVRTTRSVARCRSNKASRRWRVKAIKRSSGAAAPLRRRPLPLRRTGKAHFSLVTPRSEEIADTRFLPSVSPPAAQAVNS